MEMKEYRGIELSRLGMGNMRLPTVGDDPAAPIDRPRAQEIIDYAMRSGVNYYDTAYVYHNHESESFLGEALSKYNRDSYYLATKFYVLSNLDFRAVFEEQLGNLRTDHIDFYLIHGIMDTYWEKYLEDGCIEYFLEEQAKGRIKYLGFSSHATPEVLEKFADHHKWDFAQIQMNYFDWVIGPTRREYEILTGRDIPIMVMEPVRGGKLAAGLPEDAVKRMKEAHPDWSPASWALRWVASCPGVQVILSGMSTMEQIRDNVATFSSDMTFTEDDRKLMEAVGKEMHDQLGVPCTGCRYCCDDCPSSINIPEYLTVYNQYKVNGDWGIDEVMAKVESDGLPSDCVACGACTEHCPQSIAVLDAMAELAKLEKK